MRTRRGIPLLIASVLTAVCIGACSGDESPRSQSFAGTFATASDTVNVIDQLTVAAVLHSDARFSSFVTALDTTGLLSNLEQEGPFTVFAPPNASFSGTAGSLYAPENHGRLRDVLLHHLSGENLTVGELRRRDSLRLATLEGTPLTIRRRGGQYTVNGIPLVNTSVTVGNGTVYVLNGALNPPASATAPASGAARSSNTLRP